MSFSYSPPFNSPIVDNGGFITPLWSAFFEEFVKDTATTSIPVGGVILFTGSDEPSGWFFCDGREVSRRLYQILFSVIGTRYGPGNGVDTFNIPDKRGKFIKGASAPGVLDEGGQSTVTISLANLPDIAVTINDPGHIHAFTGASTAVPVTDPGHAHAITDPGHSHARGAAGPTSTTAVTGASPTYSPTSTAVSTTGITVNSATTGITIPNITPLGSIGTHLTGITAANISGGGQAFSIEPPFITVSFIIKY